MVELLRTFATQSALAIQNARLFRQLEAKSREVEVASRHKSEFLANMSHELRTPLNAIIGYSEMLEEEAQDLGQEAFVPDLRKINAAGKHLLELINAVLDLSKIEAGSMELYLEDFEVPTLVRDIAAVIHPLAEKNRNRLEVRCAPDAGEHARRPHQGAPGALQSPQQCVQVHRGRHGGARRRAGRGRRRLAHLRGDRHRDRHDARADGAALRELPPGRCLACRGATAARGSASRCPGGSPA